MPQPIFLLLVFILPAFIQISSFAQGIIKAESGTTIVSGTGSCWVVNGAFTMTSPNASAPATMNNLTIESGSSLIIAPLSCLTVNGALANSGTFTLSSTSAGTGSLLASGTSTGNITTQRYIPAATWSEWDDGWHFLSSPVADYPITVNFTAVQAADYDFYAWSEPSNLWVNFKDGTSPTFLQANGSTTFELGHGYMAAYKTDSTKSFTGPINVADVTVSGLTVTGSTQTNRSWHLLGNPFTCAVTWDATWTKTNIGGTIQIWNEAGKSYTAINSSTPGVIPATNGFMVQSTDAISGSVTIPAGKRTHSSQAFYKSAGFPLVKLKASNLDNPSWQESQLLFNPNSTPGFDIDCDGDFLAGYAPKFYSRIGDLPMAVNSLPGYSENTRIPLTFIKNDGLNFRIELSEKENMNMDIWLLDKKTGNEQNLTQNPVYLFTAFNHDASDRFLLHFGAVGIDDQKITTNKPRVWQSGGTLHIESALNIESVEVFDMHGRKMFANIFNGPSLSIQLNMPAGIYLAVVRTNQQITSAKVFFQ